jgi:hypothetical protein
MRLWPRPTIRTAFKGSWEGDEDPRGRREKSITRGYIYLQIAYIAYNFITMRNFTGTKIPLTPESEVGYAGSVKASGTSRQRQTLRKVGAQNHGSKARDGYDRRVAERGRIQPVL